MSTQDNLKAAFAGESQANRMYLAFAKKADDEGFAQVARLFRAAAAAETVHAHAHLRAMDGIKSTLENLGVAAGGEEHEFKSMYPAFVAEAEKEGDRRALISFKNAMTVEEIHFGLYNAAVEAVKAGNDLPATTVHVCNVCGNTVYGDAPDKCPVCGALKSMFSEVQ